MAEEDNLEKKVDEGNCDGQTHPNGYEISIGPEWNDLYFCDDCKIPYFRYNN